MRALTPKFGVGGEIMAHVGGDRGDMANVSLGGRYGTPSWHTAMSFGIASTGQLSALEATYTAELDEKTTFAAHLEVGAAGNGGVPSSVTTVGYRYVFRTSNTILQGQVR